ncbi:MAG TPA: patatin-like protein [Thermoanaerobaculia bacterium]|nr:patatin-like protein [Thermoanaerobaculia bacterium]
MRCCVAVLSLLLALNAAAAEARALPATNAVRELRLGVVCYGGVSLAIYMYGITRELHHLALASAALECDGEGGAAACGRVVQGTARQTLPPAAQVYYDALAGQWHAERVRTRVVIDVVSGTSAGGINGIILAKAIAHNRPIVGLRRVWFEEADITRLATGRPWPLRAAFRLARGKSALGGDSWLKQLYLALNKMDEQPGDPVKTLPSLTPAGQSIELLVTATDFYGSGRLLEIGDPATSWERRYDQVFRFAMERAADGSAGKTDFDRSSNAALAFAARSSASFPVAFPAIRLDDLERALGEKVNTADLARRLFSDRLSERRDDAAAEQFARNVYLVDGGILDNYPFSIAYARVSRRAPVLETRRVFIYIEPDPRPSAALAGPAGGDAQTPTAFQMLWSAKASIPGAEPIAQDLIEISRHNERVQRIAEIVRRDEDRARQELLRSAPGDGGEASASVARRVERAMKLRAYDLAKPEMLRESVAPMSSKDDQRQRALEVLQQMREAVEEDAASRMPLAEEAYVRLRVQSVLDQLGRVMATALCGVPEDYDGPRRSLMRSIVAEWAERERLIGSDVAPQRRDEFLRAFDLGYLRRRLRFVSDWLNAQYDPARYEEHDYRLERNDIREARQAIAIHVGELSGVLRGQRLRSLGLGDELDEGRKVLCVPVDEKLPPRQQARQILDQRANADAVDRLERGLERELLDVQRRVLAELYADFVRETSRWNNPTATRAVLARYLGFPYWDRVSYPYTAFSGTGDMTQIHIMRFSPNDAPGVSSKNALKLAGSGLAHFGAFFDRNGRERDYVWGRLDGAERVLALLGISQPSKWRATALDAILDEEQAARAVAAKNLQFMRDCVAKPGSC